MKMCKCGCSLLILRIHKKCWFLGVNLKFHDFSDFSCPKPVILVILKFKLTPGNGREELFEFFFTNEFPVLRLKIQKTDDFCRFLFIFQEIWIFLCFCLHNSHFGVFFWDSNGSAKPTAKRTGFKISCHFIRHISADFSAEYCRPLLIACGAKE